MNFLGICFCLSLGAIVGMFTGWIMASTKVYRLEGKINSLEFKLACMNDDRAAVRRWMSKTTMEFETFRQTLQSPPPGL